MATSSTSKPATSTGLWSSVSNSVAAALPTPKATSGSINKPTVGGSTTTTPATPAKPPAIDPATQAAIDAANAKTAGLQAQLDALKAAQEKAAAQTAANQRNIAAQLTDMFNTYDLGSLAPQITSMIQSGMGGDEVTLALQQTNEYKQRFAANETRRKKGMNVLSPAEYIATERAYRQLMQAAGLPTGFYDSNADFQKFLENDVSPTEVKARVDAASEAINQAPPGTLGVFQQWYSTGDLIAYALDPTVAEPLIEQRIKAAEASASGSQQGLSISQNTAEQIGKQNLSLSQMQSGMFQAGADHGNAAKLGQIYGSEFTDDNLVKATFGADAASADKLKKLASQERGTFSGTGNVSSNSLSSNSGGKI